MYQPLPTTIWIPLLLPTRTESESPELTTRTTEKQSSLSNRESLAGTLEETVRFIFRFPMAGAQEVFNIACQRMACEYTHSDGSAMKLPTPTGLPTHPPAPNFHMLIFRNHKTPPESRMNATLLIYMETSTTSTIPAVIHSPALFGRQYLGMLREGERLKHYM